jgi:ABC-type transporter Mla MlaB component
MKPASVSRRGEADVLRITTQETGHALRLRLEGRLTGTWVPELEAAWRAARHAHPGQPLLVDLREVDVVDAAGRYLLALLHEAGVGFEARGCAMCELVREITGGPPVTVQTSR